MIHWLKNKLHIHCFNKPIVSQYVSFHQRDIIYECKCDKRKMQREYRNFGDAFPIETKNFITDAEMQKILTNENTN